MKQNSLDLNLCARKTRKQVFLQQMDAVVPWAALVDLIAPYLLRRSQRAPALCVGNRHAARALHAAVVQPVESYFGSSYASLDTSRSNTVG